MNLAHVHITSIELTQRLCHTQQAYVLQYKAITIVLSLE